MAEYISPSKRILISQPQQKLGSHDSRDIPSQIWPHYINSAWALDTLSSKHHKAFTGSSLNNLARCLVGELIIT